MAATVRTPRRGRPDLDAHHRQQHPRISMKGCIRKRHGEQQSRPRRGVVSCCRAGRQSAQRTRRNKPSGCPLTQLALGRPLQQQRDDTRQCMRQANVPRVRRRCSELAQRIHPARGQSLSRLCLPLTRPTACPSTPTPPLWRLLRNGCGAGQREAGPTSPGEARRAGARRAWGGRGGRQGGRRGGRMLRKTRQTRPLGFIRNGLKMVLSFAPRSSQSLMQS